MALSQSRILSLLSLAPQYACVDSSIWSSEMCFGLLHALEFPSWMLCSWYDCRTLLLPGMNLSTGNSSNSSGASCMCSSTWKVWCTVMCFGLMHGLVFPSWMLCSWYDCHPLPLLGMNLSTGVSSESFTASRDDNSRSRGRYVEIRRLSRIAQAHIIPRLISKRDQIPITPSVLVEWMDPL